MQCLQESGEAIMLWANIPAPVITSWDTKVFWKKVHQHSCLVSNGLLVPELLDNGFFACFQ
jgi:hypothetical protein